MKPKKLINKIFEIGIGVKAVFGFFEILGGILFSISDRFITNNFIIFLAHQEIIEDPNDLIANYIISSANNLANGSQLFAVFYLFFHGAVNIFLAAGLLRNKLWAYPAAIWLFGGFMAYQLYRFMHTFSLALLVLIIFDAFVISVIWLEYKKKKKGALGAK